MVKSEFIQELNRKMPEMPSKDMALALRCIIDWMEAALAEGERIEIRGFGSFHLRQMPPRLGRNPKTGEMVQLKERAFVRFKPGKEMRDRVNHTHQP